MVFYEKGGMDMERIRNLSIYQKVILLILSAMVVLFGLVYIRATSLEGYAYKEEIFLPSYETTFSFVTVKLQSES